MLLLPRESTNGMYVVLFVASRRALAKTRQAHARSREAATGGDERFFSFHELNISVHTVQARCHQLRFFEFDAVASTRLLATNGTKYLRPNTRVSCGAQHLLLDQLGGTNTTCRTRDVPAYSSSSSASASRRAIASVRAASCALPLGLQTHRTRAHQHRRGVSICGARAWGRAWGPVSWVQGKHAASLTCTSRPSRR